MKKQLSLALALACSLGASASGQIDLQGTTFRTDTLEHYTIGPGVTHTHLKLSGARTIHVYAVTLDREADTEGIAKMKVVIGNDRCLNGESISSMARRKTTDSEQIIAGINGDFFITSAFAAQHEFGNAILGYPNMSCIIDGKIAAPDMIDITSRENALIMGPEGWWIDATDLTYKLLNNDGSTVVSAKAVNYPRRDNELMVYNSYMGATTATAAGGREIALRPAEGAQWRVNGSVKFIVDGEWSALGNMAVPADGIVISCGKDYHNDFIDGLKAGDIVKLKIGLSLPAFGGIKPEITDVIGGDVRILNENKVTTEAIRWINTPGSAYPRSLVGYSQDRNKMVFATVDGGTYSSGVSYYEAADLMRALGCWDALDFDGGGSTALWMAHTGIANKPRDGAERAVGNGLFVSLNAPADQTVTSIRFADHVKTMPLYGSYTPRILGYNRYGQLVDADYKDFSLSVDAANGNIDNQTTFIAGAPGTFALTAHSNDMEAKIALTVDGSFTAEADVETLLIDGEHTVVLPISAVVGGEKMPVAANAFSWKSDDETVAKVDAATGEISAVASGETVVTGTRDECTLSVKVIVEMWDQLLYPVDLKEHPADSWKVSRTGVKNVELTVTPEGVLEAAFEISSTRGTNLTLAKDIRLYSLPRFLAIGIDCEGVDYNDLTVKLQFADETRPESITFKPGDENYGSFWGSIERGVLSYPVVFKSLGITPKPAADGNKKGLLRVVNIISSLGVPVGVRDVIADNGGEGMLAVSYDGDTLVCDASGLEIYNMSGACIARAEGNTIAMPRQKGIYIVRSGARAVKIAVR